ncbi:hypothetical protein L873DRAFT_1032475 [Choiromyces venosus 120613-1]|uniref:Uncharacterized protein n=1 Tax=Choiromyces venosus 120613-1 TaxID=1336337 RepID=A0A3N4JJU5_9PEZI|nr:hypothetical protein L873DRAFT_1032475 [Choiromyces venosus 120613-1]
MVAGKDTPPYLQKVFQRSRQTFDQISIIRIRGSVIVSVRRVSASGLAKMSVFFLSFIILGGGGSGHGTHDLYKTRLPPRLSLSFLFLFITFLIRVPTVPLYRYCLVYHLAGFLQISLVPTVIVVSLGE